MKNIWIYNDRLLYKLDKAATRKKTRGDWYNYGSGSATCSDCLKGWFTLTEDVSINTQFLEAKILRAEDSDVYYCAGQTQ